MTENGNKSKKRPKYEEVAEKIREKIMVSQEYAPGDRLPDERALALEYGVSRTAIRDAVKILDTGGVIVVKKALGIFVADHPGVPADMLGMKYIENKKKMMEDWYAVRLALEPEMIRMVVENATEEDVAEIIRLSKEESEAVQNGQTDFLEIDKNFHAMLAKATHNEVMERVIRSLQQSIYYGTVFEKLPMEITKEALRLHDEIVKFLEKRDVAGAMLAMRYHLLWAINNSDYFAT